MTLSRTQWETVLDEADPPTYGEVLDVLQDKDLVDDPVALVDGAVDAGTLHEKQGGAFPELALQDADSSATADDFETDDAERGFCTHETARREASLSSERWEAADFATPTSGTWPAELLEREQWMGHVAKKPFAPWADRDHPEADVDEDARWKWRLTENYVDGETVALAEDDPRLDGRAFLQQPDDPYVYVDGDDVRDPETSDIHPAFVATLEHLGLTYADISQSDAGAHAIYRGELPDGVKQAAWQLDDAPWGANDDLPSIEIYPGKRVCVMTGHHVPGTPTEVREWNADVLKPLLEANDEVATRQREDLSTARDDYDLDDYEPGATTTVETADEIRDVFAALDRIDARAVAERTIVHSWNDDASTSEGKRALVPIWGKSSNGTANIVDERIWQDTGGYGGPVVMALIDIGKMRPSDASPRAASGQLWWEGIEHLRSLGFDIPEFNPSEYADAHDRDDVHPLLEAAIDSDGEDVGAEPVSALPIGQLDHLTQPERKRAAKKRGLDWPSTREARDELFATITEAMANNDDTVVDAPTSLGKTPTVTSTAWNSTGRYDKITGGKPVVHLSKTRDARNEAAATAADADGVNQFVLLGRHEACPIAAGDHDPRQAAEDDEKVGITMDGQPASEWLTMMCEGRGIPFSHAHTYLEEHNDQGIELPCCRSEPTTYDEEGGDFDEGNSGTCDAIEQWHELRSLRDSDSQTLDVIIATHNFAHVPGLRMQTNIVIDEEPDFTADLDQDRVRRAVSAYL
ncbi:hypothetical protein [Halobacterium wangiae]|uniref:hypothetical protein n=1 Tax=Halobacterium wangiae TaxID=2902623 RepID=UPI001E65B993|nr:hypothetical protein [Halobacterium wangiae]